MSPQGNGYGLEKPSNLVEFKQLYKEKLVQIPPLWCKNVFASYGKLLMAVNAAKGGTTSY